MSTWPSGFSSYRKKPFVSGEETEILLPHTICPLLCRRVGWAIIPVPSGLKALQIILSKKVLVCGTGMG